MQNHMVGLMSIACRKFYRDVRGTLAATAALSITALMGVVALALIAGDAYSVRGKTQQALDAAVLAGATLGSQASDEERLALAYRVYATNGTSRARGDATLTVHHEAPAVFTASETMVFGEIQFTMTSPFLSVFRKDELVGRVASAARKTLGSPVCILGLDPAEEATMDFNGQASLEATNCATQANSSHGAGLHQVGHPSMKATEIGVTGGYTGTAYSTPPITGTSPIPDPFATLPLPIPAACSPLSGSMIQNTTTALDPGTYCGGLSIKAGSVVTLNPGIYIFQDGPLKIDSGATVSGDDVMLAFLGPTSTLYILGGGALHVTSPTAGTYANIQFFGDRVIHPGPGNSGPLLLYLTVIGDSQLSYDGVMYTPQFDVWYAGGSQVEAKSANYAAVARKLWFQDRTQVRVTQENSRNLRVDGAAHLQYAARLFQ